MTARPKRHTPTRPKFLFEFAVQNRTQDTTTSGNGAHHSFQGRANRPGKTTKVLQIGWSRIEPALRGYPRFPVVARGLRTWRRRHVLFAREVPPSPAARHPDQLSKGTTRLLDLAFAAWLVGQLASRAPLTSPNAPRASS